MLSPVANPHKCENCPFRGRAIGGKGDPRSSFVIVGESPGKYEIRDGEPFVGESGSVLDQAIPQEIWQRGIIPWYTNAISCQPPKDKGQTVLAKACRACHSRLIEEIQRYPREVILALGGPALWSLTGDYSLKITQERGKLFDSTLAKQGIVASVHPAFLLRGGGSTRKFIDDIRYAAHLAMGRSSYKGYIATQYTVLEEKDIPDLERIILESPYDYYANDLETGGFDRISDEILCLGIAADPDMCYIIPDELVNGDLLNGMYQRLNKAGMRQVWHNGKFDMAFMRREGISEAYVHEDTMLLNYTLDETKGLHDLDQVASDEIGAPEHKHMLAPYLTNKDSSYRDVPRPVLYEYTGYDLGKTFQVFSPLREKVAQDRRSNGLYTNVLILASEMLSWVERRGLQHDEERVLDNWERLIKIEDAYEDKINEVAQKHLGHNVNPRSPKQLSELLFDALEIDAKKRSTDKTILKKCEQQHPVITDILSYRGARKARGTYVKRLMPQSFMDSLPAKEQKKRYVLADGRIHPTFNIHGTVTGRLSCSDPNMQNIPRDSLLRGQFVAAPDYVLIAPDLNQAELRCLATLSGDPNLCRIYETKGLSIHKEVSIDLWGEGWPKRYALGNTEEGKHDPRFIQAYDEYMRTKALNFGIVYGREAFSIAQEFNVSFMEAASWIERWARRFPKAWEFIKQCRSAPVRGQMLRTVFGRKRRYGVISREHLHDIQNEAANFPHQSTASDITLTSAIELEPILRSWGAFIINLVHDEIIVECPNEQKAIQDTIDVCLEVMERKPREWGLTRIPFVAEAKIGFRWGELIELDDFKGMKGVNYVKPDQLAA